MLLIIQTMLLISYQIIFWLIL